MKKQSFSRFARLVPILVLVAMVMLVISIPVSGASVDPVFEEGNPSCEDLEYAFGFKIEDEEAPDSGTYYISATLWVTISVDDDGIFFSWASNLPMDAVIVKGGQNANVFVYDPPAEAIHDEGLYSPDNPGGIAAISHIEFCYDFEVEVTKTAETTFTRTYEWDIDKSATPGTLDMFTGDTGVVEYTIDVTKDDGTDSGWAVSGQITVHNPAPSTAIITDVTDSITGGIVATVICPVSFPYQLAAGQNLVCSYSSPLPDGSARTNTATATTSGAVGGDSGTADVTFGDPTTEVNATVTVEDTNVETTWEFSDDGTASYYLRFGCDVHEGQQDNTATIIETGQSDDASVDVNCYDLTVTKSAVTSYTRTFDWTIEKSVLPEEVDLFTGDSAEFDWTVTINKDAGTDSDFAVTGTITIANNHPSRAATINSVADVVENGDDDVNMTVVCPADYPFTVPAGGSVDCTYSGTLPDGDDTTNTATATQQNHDYTYDELGNESATPIGTTAYDGTAPVDFDPLAPTETVHDTVTYGDVLTFPNGTTSVLDVGDVITDDTVFPYSQEVMCDADAGEHTNVATIVGDDVDGDNEPDLEKSATETAIVNCYALTVTKDADESLTRTWTWTIDKSADQTDLMLSQGQSFAVNYTVEVDAASADSAWAVSGGISVLNDTPLDAELTGVSDVVSPAIAATVDCGVPFPHILPAGETLECDYSAGLPDAANRTNTATATIQNYGADGVADGTTNFTGTALVDFDEATVNEVDECINVNDTLAGFLGTVCADAAPETFEYALEFGTPLDADVVLECGDNTRTNIADFVTNDTGATGDDEWTVNATVECLVGCTLTQGYWKTHSEHGPAPYDDTWALLPNGADTIFFSSGQTYHAVLWTPPRGGNAYYILAHQYIAAQLNQLNGASTTPQVDAAFAAATTLFNTYTPAQVGALKGKNGNAVRSQFIALAGTLGSYNEGAIGPGHCDEDSNSAPN